MPSRTFLAPATSIHPPTTSTRTPLNMSDQDHIDSRTADPPQLHYTASSALATPTLADQATYDDSRGYMSSAATAAASSTDIASTARFSTQSASTVPGITPSSTLVDSSIPSSNTPSMANNGPTMEDIVPTQLRRGRAAFAVRHRLWHAAALRSNQAEHGLRKGSVRPSSRSAPSLKDEYARSMAKLARSTFETYSLSDAKAGSFVKSWHSMVKTHDTIADNRSAILGQAQRDERRARQPCQGRSTRVASMRARRACASRRTYRDAEAGVEKARGPLRHGGRGPRASASAQIGRVDKVGRDPGRLRRAAAAAESARSARRSARAGCCSRTRIRNRSSSRRRRSAPGPAPPATPSAERCSAPRASRQEYFNLQLPRILRTLKENAEEIDNGTQYHLSRYAFLYESTVLNDGMAISPVGTDVTPTSGLKARSRRSTTVPTLSSTWPTTRWRMDATTRGPRQGRGRTKRDSSTTRPHPRVPLPVLREHPRVSERAIFGVDLAEQMARDSVEIPPILEKCAPGDRGKSASRTWASTASRAPRPRCKSSRPS
ncbi:hypothetical protein L1887_59930 [Cichorium endivia]|nr:hypothetical protein L1887_59930 [Cichorium endivia]